MIDTNKQKALYLLQEISDLDGIINQNINAESYENLHQLVDERLCLIKSLIDIAVNVDIAEEIYCLFKNNYNFINKITERMLVTRSALRNVNRLKSYS